MFRMIDVFVLLIALAAVAFVVGCDLAGVHQTIGSDPSTPASISFQVDTRSLEEVFPHSIPAAPSLVTPVDAVFSYSFDGVAQTALEVSSAGFFVLVPAGTTWIQYALWFKKIVARDVVLDVPITMFISAKRSTDTKPLVPSPKALTGTGEMRLNVVTGRWDETANPDVSGEAQILRFVFTPGKIFKEVQMGLVGHSRYYSLRKIALTGAWELMTVFPPLNQQELWFVGDGAELSDFNSPPGSVTIEIVGVIQAVAGIVKNQSLPLATVVNTLLPNGRMQITTQENVFTFQGKLLPVVTSPLNLTPQPATFEVAANVQNVFRDGGASNGVFGPIMLLQQLVANAPDWAAYRTADDKMIVVLPQGEAFPAGQSFALTSSGLGAKFALATEVHLPERYIVFRWADVVGNPPAILPAVSILLQNQGQNDRFLGPPSTKTAPTENTIGWMLSGSFVVLNLAMPITNIKS